MSDGEKRMFWRGVAAGTVVGLALGAMMSLLIAMKPDLVAALIR